MREHINVLFVIQDADPAKLLGGSAGEPIELFRAGSCADARALISTRRRLDVVVSSLTLNDGNWFCIHQDLARRNLDAELIVLAPEEGLPCSEILAHGVYAVLGQPLKNGQLMRVIKEAAARGAARTHARA